MSVYVSMHNPLYTSARSPSTAGNSIKHGSRPLCNYWSIEDYNAVNWRKYCSGIEIMYLSVWPVLSQLSSYCYYAIVIVLFVEGPANRLSDFCHHILLVLPMNASTFQNGSCPLFPFSVDSQKALFMPCIFVFSRKTNYSTKSKHNHPRLKWIQVNFGNRIWLL